MRIVRSKKDFALVAAAMMLVAGSAGAADLGGARSHALNPIYEPQSAFHRHMYVRGDVGIGRHAFGDFSQAELATNKGSFLTTSIDDAAFVSAGIGFKLSPMLRLDLTGDYRGSAQVRALDNVTARLASPAGQLQANTAYAGSMSSYVGLLNAYWDLFNMRGITPYVGAGIGFAHHRAGPFTTATSASFTPTVGDPLIEVSSGSSAASSKTNFAWALMAGTSFDLSQNSKLDIGYRYLNMGSGISFSTGLIDCVCGTTGSPLNVSDLKSHEFRIGVRWLMGSASETHRTSMK